MAEDNNPAAERLYKQREAVAKEFNLDIGDWRVRQLALLQARHAAAEDEMINGVSIDIGQLLALNQAIADMRGVLKVAEGGTINVHICEAARGIFNCQFCGKETPIEDYEAPPPPAPPPVLPQYPYLRPI